MDLPPELLEKPIAALEEYGLPIRIVNLIEGYFDAIYIKDMLHITRKDFLEASGMGKRSLELLQMAIQGMQKVIICQKIRPEEKID